MAKEERRRKKEDPRGAGARRAERDARKAEWKADLARRGVPEDKAYLLETADVAGRGRCLFARSRTGTRPRRNRTSRRPPRNLSRDTTH